MHLNNDARVLAAIRRGCVETELPSAAIRRVISVAEVKRIAAEYACSARNVERIALEDGVLPARYSRNASSFCASEQRRLLSSTVCVVGVGGLGSWLCEILARSGVGTLHIIDFDRFDDTNLNRQLYADENVAGSFKAEVAARRLAEVNSAIDVHARVARLDARNAKELLSGCDVVADCVDSIHWRFALERAAVSIGVPVVSAAVAGNNGQLLTIHPGGSGFSAVYGPEEDAPERGFETELGNLPHTVAALASLQAAEVIRVLLGGRGQYAGRLLFVDLSDGTFRCLDLG